MRDRAWRRDMSDRVFYRRLKQVVAGRYNSRYHRDANGYLISDPVWMDMIGTMEAHNIRSFGKPYESYGWWESKYSPNKANGKKGMWGRPGDNENTREYNTRLLRKIKQEYGIK
jgi:hypothetical protein